MYRIYELIIDSVVTLLKTRLFNLDKSIWMKYELRTKVDMR